MFWWVASCRQSMFMYIVFRVEGGFRDAEHCWSRLFLPCSFSFHPCLCVATSVLFTCMLRRCLCFGGLLRVSTALCYIYYLGWFRLSAQNL